MRPNGSSDVEEVRLDSTRPVHDRVAGVEPTTRITKADLHLLTGTDSLPTGRCPMPRALGRTTLGREVDRKLPGVGRIRRTRVVHDDVAAVCRVARAVTDAARSDVQDHRA